LFSDNNGLVCRITQRQQYVDPYPNATLAPDWDVIEQIYQLLTGLPTTDLSVEWVKGHQDETPNDLSVAAIYNIRADELAGQVLASANKVDSQPPLLPVEKCRLVIRQRTIQGHFSRAIRDAYTLPAYYEYLRNRHGWTETQCQQLDWESFRRAASHIPFSRVQLVKLVHSKLPTNRELAKSNQYQSPTCHYCEEQETFIHLLQCRNPTSAAFRSDLIDSKKKKTKVYLFTDRKLPSNPARALSARKHCLSLSTSRLNRLADRLGQWG
jgi:hypothetical protein